MVQSYRMVLRTIVSLHPMPLKISRAYMPLSERCGKVIAKLKGLIKIQMGEVMNSGGNNQGKRKSVN